MTRRLRIAAPVLLAAAAAACSSPATVTTGTDPTAATDPTATPATSDAARPGPTTSIVDPTPATTAAATTTTTEPAPTTTSPPGVDHVACAAAIPLRDRIALLVWPAVYPTDWPTALQTVEQERVGGVVLFAPEDWSPDDVATELTRLDEVAARGLVISTDEEGGAVQRLSVLGPLPSQQVVSEESDPAAAERIVAEHAERLAAAGVDMALGPVVDVVPPTGEVPLTRSRFFTGDASEVAVFARAYVEGWNSAGLAAVLKHYPGHGAASGDTHDEAGITPSLDELERSDLLPFRELADTGAAVMVGHLTVPGLTDDVPATRSARAVSYLRDELGYADALVMTDALGMQAVGLPEDVAAPLAIEAGIDVVIFTLTTQTGAVIDAIGAAVGDGTIPEERITESAARVLRLLDDDRSGCEPT